MIVLNKFMAKQRKVVQVLSLLKRLKESNIWSWKISELKAFPSLLSQDIITDIAEIDASDYTPPPEQLDEVERNVALTNLGKIILQNQVQPKY